MRFSGFSSRVQAGQLLAKQVLAKGYEKPVVLALPRGGVPVAAELALALKSPLDLILVRKIGVPWQRELAAAAIVDGERRDIVYNEEVMMAVGLHKDEIEKAAVSEFAEIDRRRAVYLRGREPLTIDGCTAIVVDDGIATGTTVKVALMALKRRKPKRLVLAVPVAPPDTIGELRPLVDDIICLELPEPFIAIGLYYQDFHQVGDDEVVECLSRVFASLTNT